MPHSAFELCHSENIPTLKVKLEDYRHRKTGARHIHLASDDDNNVFLVAFLTVPSDSRGVAHILEHTSLCGSERYPVRDPFFMMIRRSLNTFMNAFTSSDWTAYPFASQNKKDFDNLLQVYLDAAFFPKLDELDFAQEGHRVEFAKANDSGTPLVYKGVVFNEMKGAMSSPVRRLWTELSALLYPTTTYHYNSGGEPEEIPKLTYGQLKAFHAEHYHPSNALFMTYGDLPAAHHQSYMEDCALHRFDALDVSHLAIKDEKRYDKPLHSQTVYALEKEQDTQRKTHIVTGWLLGNSTNQREALQAQLLSGVLLDNSSSPLQHALETTELGTSPSPLGGLETSNREMLFCCGVEGSEPEHAGAVEKLILDTIAAIAENGVAQEQVESVLHQIELSQREISGDHAPYGLNLLVNSLSPVIHGADPVDVLNIDPVLEELRRDIQDPEFIKQLAKRLLLDNPHRVHLVMSPDQELDSRLENEEKAHLAELKKSLSPEQKQALIEQATALEKRQNTSDDPELLPKVTLDDVAEDLKIAQGTQQIHNGLKLDSYAQGTNGMVYQHIVAELPDLDDGELDLLPLLCNCLSEVGTGGRDYLQTQAWQAAVTGSVGASCPVRGALDDVQQLHGHFVVSGKALARNQEALSEVLHATFTQARFDELPRLRELIAQTRASVESRITGHGHNLAMSAAAAGFTPLAALNHRWSGLRGIQQIKSLDDTLRDAAELDKFAARLAALRDKLIQTPRRFLLISEEEQTERFQQSLAAHWQESPADNAGQVLHVNFGQTKVKQIWTTGTQVNFCSRAYPAVPYAHADAPALTVLGGFLRNGYLHRRIREQGGAYGGGAGFNSDTGVFRFYSYRDPRLEETLTDFDKSLEWLQAHKHEPRTLEEAILGVISQIDSPASPAGEAKRAFYSALNGRTPERRREFRKRILHVNLEDLQRVAATYLQPQQAATAVLSNAQSAQEKAAELGLEVFSL